MYNCIEGLVQAACIDKKLYYCWIRYTENLHMLWLKLHWFNSGDTKDIWRCKIILRLDKSRKYIQNQDIVWYLPDYLLGALLDSGYYVR